MKIKKALVLASTSLLCFPSLFFPVISMSIPVSALENSVELPKESQLIDSLGSTTETKAPIFSFEESQEPHMAGKQFELVVHASQEVSEFLLNLPEGVSIVEDKQSADIKFTNIEGNQWQVLVNSPQMAFSIPLIIEEEGEYEVAIGESKTTLYIHAEESQQRTEQEVTSEEKEAEKTEETNDEPSSTTETSENHSEQVMENARSTKETGVQDVANWQEFIRAFVDPTVNYINVIADFETPDNPVSGLTGVTGATSNPNGGTVFVYVNASQVSRKLVIEGNGHQIDFRAVSLGFHNSSVNSNNPWDITLQNIEIYHGNWYGPIMYIDLNTQNQTAARIHYHNVKNVGNQLLHSVLSSVTMSGNVSSNQVATYTSKFRTWNINNIAQANLEINQLDILDDAKINLSSINSGNIDLLNANGRLTVGDNVEMTVAVNGNGTGEALGSNIAVRSSGNVTIGNNSKIELLPQNNYPAITLPGANSRFEMKENSHVNISSSGRTVSTNNSSSNIVFMAGGSTMHIGKQSSFEIDAVNQGTSASNVIHVAGAATFIVDKEGTLDIKSDSTAAAQSILAFTNANSTFSFSDAKMINLQRTNTISGTATTNGLINISGSAGLLDVDVQSVRQWQRGNLGEEPDFSWNPIFNLKINYAGTLPTINTVSSVSQDVVDNFRNNFTTRAQRVLFEYIPDVEVTIDPLTEDPNEVNSHTITGKANPNSVIRFSGDPAIPSGSIPSPDISESEKYHTTADENGDYRYELPEDRRFTAGNTVTAYAFLNGKNDTASTMVEEKIVVAPVDPLDPETEVEPENKPEIPEDQGRLSLDFVSQFNFETQKISVSDQTYYAQPQRLLNEDGTVNETKERPNYVQISDRRAANERNGWQLSVTQNGQFRNESGHELIGSEIQLFNQELVTAQGGTKPELQEEPVQRIVPNTRKVLIQANGESGTGTWIYRFGDQQTADKSVSLYVPGGTNPEATSYSTKLTWELSAVPGN
ncbi:WxL domain-containing protein [Enterococcus pernyi]|nr:WxL domain-containing protein [Enterococcus pernyi]